MAYVSPSTRAVGHLVTAANWNQDVKDNIIFLHDPPACRAFHSTSQSATHDNYTALALDSERFDNFGMHSTVTNNSRISVVEQPVGVNNDGVYLISGHFAGTWDKGTYIGDIRLNGGDAIAQKFQRQSNASAIFQAISLSTIYFMVVGDYVELVCRPLIDAGSGSITIDRSTAYTPELAVEWIGAGV